MSGLKNQRQNFRNALWINRNQHHIKNTIAFIGFVTTIIFRLWGFSPFICVLALFLLKAKPKQYLGVLIADIISAAILYFHDGFYIPFHKIAGQLIVFAMMCLIYWLLTLEYSTER